jgi:hypothetical protein
MGQFFPTSVDNEAAQSLGVVEALEVITEVPSRKSVGETEPREN